MKCEECLPLIEEYVDGELNEGEAARLESHVMTCAACAEELETLSHEQEVYARYQRDVEVTPAQWNIVRARIERESDAQTSLAPEQPRRKRWFGSIFAPLSSFRPALIAALVLIAVGTTIGVMYLNYRNQKPDVARVEKPKDFQKANPPTGVTQPIRQDAGDEATAGNRGARTSVPAPVGAKNSRPRHAGNNKPAVLAKVPRPVYRQRAPDVLGTAIREEAAVRKTDPLSGDFDFDISRHAERAQMLLRSFRNMQTEESSHATDVSYEKEQSRKLLYQNIALRRNAEERRDERARELLDTLEPILLDIANLPNKPRAREVRLIEQRMEKKEIVAALQVRRLLTSN